MLNFQQDHLFGSLDELNAAPTGWDTDISQLRQADGNIRFSFSSGRRISINRTELCHPTLQRGSTPAGMRTFSLLTQCGNTHTFRGRNIDKNTLITIPQDRELHAVSSGSVTLLSFSIELDTLHRALEDLELPAGALDSLPEAAIISNERRANVLSTLGNLIRHMQVPESSTADCDIEEELTTDLVQELFNGGKAGRCVPRAKRHRVVKTALDYIHQHPREATCITALAMEVGASRRTLETSFRETVDMSPNQYIKTSRLRGCRKELMLQQSKSPGTSVSAIANAWGFSHLGQFAADYRRLFGELPTQTLRP